MIDLIGYAALALNLFSMAAKDELKLRILSAVANSIYVLYGLLIGSLPITIGCFIAVVLHLYRIHKSLVKQ